MRPPKNRVFIVDDHPVVRQGLNYMIDQEPDLITCGTAADGRAALAAIAATRPAVLLVDISMPGMDGLELIKTLSAQAPDVRILVLSMHDELIYAERALRAGAHGYIMKHEAETSVIAAIRRLLLGEIYLSATMTTRLLRRVSDTAPLPMIGPVELLSDRELQIFSMIGRGQRTTAIAEALSISVKTVESHRSRIRTKLNLPGSVELQQQAVIWVERQSPAR